jgi:hypothetical protein
MHKSTVNSGSLPTGHHVNACNGSYILLGSGREPPFDGELPLHVYLTDACTRTPSLLPVPIRSHPRTSQMKEPAIPKQVVTCRDRCSSLARMSVYVAKVAVRTHHTLLLPAIPGPSPPFHLIGYRTFQTSCPCGYPNSMSNICVRPNA